MSKQPDQSENERGSVARTPEPAHVILFPGVKLELAVVILLLACLWFGVAVAALPRLIEAGVLLGGSLAGAGWLVWRTRRAADRAFARNRGVGSDGA